MSVHEYDRTFTGGGRSHRLPHGCTMSESQCPSLNCMILYGSYFREFWCWLICHQQPATSHLPLCSSTTGTSSAQNTQKLHVDSTRHPKRTEMFKRQREHVECVKTPQPQAHRFSCNTTVTSHSKMFNSYYV